MGNLHNNALFYIPPDNEFKIHIMYFIQCLILDLMYETIVIMQFFIEIYTDIVALSLNFKKELKEKVSRWSGHVSFPSFYSILWTFYNKLKFFRESTAFFCTWCLRTSTVFSLSLRRKECEWGERERRLSLSTCYHLDWGKCLSMFARLLKSEDISLCPRMLV